MNSPVDMTTEFRGRGYVRLPGFLQGQRLEQLRAFTEAALNPLQAPVEYEAEVGYPGAPSSLDARGGATPRRLLYACSRHPALRELATEPRLGALLAPLLEGVPLLSQCHHNCLMTKHPGYSSATAWHQDIRYWAFERPDLVSAWFALTDEHADNGALHLIPGSHQLSLPAERFDERLFLREDLDDNAALIAQAEPVRLDAGDLLLFHCRAFHAAGVNRTQAVKLSAVFTYHASDNLPVRETRSARYPSLPLGAEPLS